MKIKHYGIPAIILASFFFASFSALNRIVPQNIGTFHQLLIRSFLMGGVFLVAGFIRKDFSRIATKDIPLIILRGFFIIGDFATFFIAISYLQIGVMLFLFYASTIIANYLYGLWILREEINKIKLISFCLAIIGLATMYITNLHAFFSIFVFFGLFSGLSYGLGVASSKNLSDTYSINQVNAMAFLASGLLSIPLLLLSHEQSRYTFFTIPWLSFFIWILAGVLAFYVIIYGFKYVEAQKASLLSLSEIIFGLCIGYIIFREIPTVPTIIGGVIIIVALALPNIRLGKLKKAIFL